MKSPALFSATRGCIRNPKGVDQCQSRAHAGPRPSRAVSSTPRAFPIPVSLRPKSGNARLVPSRARPWPHGRPGRQVSARPGAGRLGAPAPEQKGRERDDWLKPTRTSESALGFNPPPLSERPSHGTVPMHRLWRDRNPRPYDPRLLLILRFIPRQAQAR